MLRQLTRLAGRAAASGPPEQWGNLQQPWHCVLQAMRQPAACASHQAALGGPAAAAAAAARAACLQHSWRSFSQSTYEQTRARHKRGITDGGLYLGAVVLGMIGFSYASVPLYRAFCQATGYGGAVGKSHNIETKLAARQATPDAALEARAAAREIRVWFESDVADDMPWRFVPTQEYVTIRPGDSTLAFFTAVNKSDRAITGVSTYNVVPDKAAFYFNKIQCFCFEEQRLRPGEAVDMPVFFYLDPEIVDDINCRNIHDITLSYTFFRVDDDDASNDSSSSSSGVRLHGPDDIPNAIALSKLPPETQAAIAAAAAAAGYPLDPGAVAAPAAAAAAAAAAVEAPAQVAGVSAATAVAATAQPAQQQQQQQQQQQY